MYLDVELISQEIFQFIQSKFKFPIRSVQPIHRGYQNLKWIVDTDQGKKLFIKQYHPKRYPPEKLTSVQIALRIQAQLHESGITCPKLYGLDGNYVLQTPSGIFFCLMDAYEGDLIQPGVANLEQMYDLGKVTGHMHQVLSKFPSEDLHWTPSRSKLLQKWQVQWEQANSQNRSDRVLEVLVKQRSIIDSLDFGQFQECQTGWTHWDLWMDNILFQGNQVSAILDFDRMKVVYPDLDVARAILSGAYSVDKGIHLEGVSAFMKGYREHREIISTHLARSFRLLWCKETPWWFTANIEDRSENPKRFFKEMCWLTDHWFDLEKLLDTKMIR